MPTFYAIGTTIQLSTTKIEDAITKMPTVNKSAQSTRNIQEVEDAFSKGSVDGTLAEDAIIDESTGSHLRFLGTHRDMPFLLVRAGEGFFNVDGRGQRTRTAARVPPLKHSGKDVADKNSLANSGASLSLDEAGVRRNGQRKFEGNPRYQNCCV